MADTFNIDAKLVIAGVEVKGDLNAGKIKFDIDTAPLKKLVADATDAARKVKAKIDGIKFNKIKLELNKTSLRSMQTQIRQTIQKAVNGIQLGQIGIATQKGPAGQSSRINRATQATERKGTFNDPITGRFQKAADAISHSAEALKQVLQGAGAQIRPNEPRKPLTSAEIRKGNKDRIKQDQAPDDLKRVITKEKAERAKQHAEDQLARNKRAAEIKKQIAQEKALRTSSHTKALAEIDTRTAREIKAMQRIKNARSKGGPAAGSPTGPGTGRGKLSDFGGGGGGGRGGVGAGASPGGPGRGAGGVNALTAALGDMTSKTKDASKEMDSLEELTFLVGKKAAAFRGVAIAINAIVTASQAAVKFVIEFNDSLIEVNKILQLSDQSLSRLGDDLIGLASKTGVAIDQTIGISEAFARAGLSGRGYGSVVELTARALTGMQGTTLDAAQATELFIQIIQQVEGGARGLNKELVTTTKLFDVLGKAEDITASKATDVQAAFKRSAASVLATGASIEEVTTLISVLQERTQRGGDVIGTALKTMAARISSSTSEATKALNSIGVSTIDAEGNLRNLFDVLQDTSIAFQTLTESEQANIAVKTAGIRQVEIFRSAVRDFGRMTDVNSQLQAANGDASRKQAAEQTKLVVTINKLQIAFQSLTKTASESILGDIFVGAIQAVTAVTEAVAKFDKQISGAISTTLGIAAAVIGFKVILPMLFGIGRAIKFFIGSQQKVVSEMSNIQKGATTAATTIETKMLTSINRSADATRRLRTEMEGVAAATERTQGRPGGGRGPGLFGGGGPGKPGNQQGGGAIIVNNRVEQQQQAKRQGRLSAIRENAGKNLKKFGRGIKNVVTNVSALSIALSVLGGVVQSSADNIRAAGNDATATTVETVGGVLQGAGTGALIGSLIAPGIGTAIGAALGGVTGGLAAFAGRATEADKKITELSKSMVLMGTITSENGNITSEASQKIEAALRNIEAASVLEVGLKTKQKERSKGGEADRQDAALKDLFSKIEQNLQTNVDPNQGVALQQKAILKELSKLLTLQTGKQGLDLSSVQFTAEGLGGAGVTDEGLVVITDGMVQLAAALGDNSEALKESLQAELALGKKIKKSPTETKEQIKAADKRQQDFTNSLSAVIAESNIFGASGPRFGQQEEAVQARDLVIALAKGQVKEDDPRFDILIKTIREKGFITGEKGFAGGSLERVGGEEAAAIIEVAKEQAIALRDERKRIKSGGNARTLDVVLKQFAEFTARNQAIKRQTRFETTAVGREQRTQEAFGGFDVNRLGEFIGNDINELQLALRIFVQDFSKEVIKLNESRIRATTPQIALADALAENAQKVLQAADETAKSEKAIATLQLQQTVSKVGDRGQQVNATAAQLRRQFPALKEAGEQGIERRLDEFKGGTVKDLKTLFSTASDKDIAEILGISGFQTAQELEGQGPDAAKQQAFIQKEIDDIKAFAKQTMGEIADNFVKQALLVIKESRQTGISPEAGLKKLQGQSPAFSNLSVKNQKTLLAATAAFGKQSVAIDKNALDKRLKFNQLSLAAIKARISEERRVLGIDKERREAAALNARAMAEELTGIRRLVAERQISKKLTDAEIAGEKSRLSRVTQSITDIKSGPEPKTDEEKKTRADQLAALEQERSKIEIDLSKKVGKQRISDMRDILKAAKIASDEGKRVAQNERGRISVLADIGRLLSVDQSAMAGFNAELSALNANFKISQAEVAAQAEAANKLENPKEKEKQLALARQAGIDVALQMARAEAKIEAKRRSAIKQVVGQLLANQQSQISAQKKVIDSTKALSDAYESYLQAVDGVVLATTQYNLALSLADVAARKTTGGFTGIREELTAVQTAFREAERMAAEMGASEKTLVEIRRQSIDQQLSLFNQLLSQQTSAARAFFTSSAQDQADLFRGISEAGDIAKLLGGSFDVFKSKAGNESALNDLGSKILALPQDMRKRIQEAIDTLKVTGGTIGGFTAEELETAINSAVLGQSAELKVDPLFEVQERVAALQQEQAKIATEQLIAANETMLDAKKQVELAEEQKALAEIQLERVKEEGDKLRGKLGELQGTLNTTLLQQVQATKQGLRGVMSAVEIAATRMITELPGAFNANIADAINRSNLAAESGGIIESDSNQTPPSASRQAMESRNEVGKNKSVDAFASNGAGANANQASSPQPNNSNNPQDPNMRTLANMLDELKALNKTSSENLSVTQEIKSDQNKNIGTAAGSITSSGQVEITVNVKGTSQVTVTGFEAGVARIAQALAETMGGFTTEDEARRIANEVIENIRKALLEKQIITVNTQ